MLDGSRQGSSANYRACLFDENIGGSPVFNTGTNGTIEALRGRQYVQTSSSLRLYQSSMTNGAIAVQVPFYSRFRYGIVRFVDYTTGSSDYGAYQPKVVLTMVGGNGPGPADVYSQDTLLTRSVADDFQFSFFVGIPQMVAYNSGN